jgi:hypothetical protein
MRLTIDIDCTPEEARAFFGMPDVSGLNRMVMDEMTKRAKDQMDTLADPARFMEQMMAMSGKSMEGFQHFVGAMGGSAPKKK